MCKMREMIPEEEREVRGEVTDPYRKGDIVRWKEAMNITLVGTRQTICGGSASGCSRNMMVEFGMHVSIILAERSCEEPRLACCVCES